MRKLFVCVLLILWCFAVTFGQDSYVLDSQSDIDNFFVDCGGCTTVNNLQIGSQHYYNHEITSLDGLSNITQIQGNLVIRNCPALLSLSGLENLTFIGDDLQILFLSELSDLTGLTNVNEITDRLWIGYNANLLSLQGLDSITQVGRVNVSGNRRLPNLNGLDNLTTLNGLHVWDNDSIVNFNGLDYLNSISTYMTIAKNPLLLNIDALSNLNNVGEDINIFENSSLQSIGGLTQINNVDGDLDINDNDALTNLDGLSNLTDVSGELNIYRNDGLTNISGLSNLISIGDDFRIHENDVLTSLDGLQNIQYVGDWLLIKRNDMLIDINAIGNIINIGESLYIKENDLLSECCAIKYLHENEVAGNYSIQYNSTNCSSLQEILDTFDTSQPDCISSSTCALNAEIQHTPAIAGQPIDFSINFLQDCAATEFDYTWDFGGGSTSDATYTYTEAGTYMVNLTAIAQDCDVCVSNSTSISILVDVQENVDSLVIFGVSNPNQYAQTVMTTFDAFYYNSNTYDIPTYTLNEPGDILVNVQDNGADYSGITLEVDDFESIVLVDITDTGNVLFAGLPTETGLKEGRIFDSNDNLIYNFTFLVNEFTITSFEMTPPDALNCEAVQFVLNGVNLPDSLHIFHFNFAPFEEVIGGTGSQRTFNTASLSVDGFLNSFGGYILKNKDGELNAPNLVHAFQNPISTGDYGTSPDLLCNPSFTYTYDITDEGYLVEFQADSECRDYFSSAYWFYGDSQQEAIFPDAPFDRYFSYDKLYSATHLYDSLGVYDVEFCLNVGACDPQSQYCITRTIDLCNQQSIKIKEILYSPNQGIYEVMEMGTVHHYYQVLDENDEPVSGISILYSLDNTTYESAPSDEMGLVDVIVKTAGDNLDSPNDDWLPSIGVSYAVEFSDIGNATCYEILENDFENFIISYTPHQPETVTNGLFGAIGANTGFCEGCEEGPLGMGGFDFGFGPNLGVNLEVKKVYDPIWGFQGYYVKLGSGLDFSLDLGFDGSLEAPVWIDTLSFNLNGDIGAKVYTSVFFDENQNQDEQSLNLLQLIFNVLKASSLENQAAFHTADVALSNYLEENDLLSDYKIGGSFKFGYEADIDVSEVQLFGSNISFDTQGIESGTSIEFGGAFGYNQDEFIRESFCRGNYSYDIDFTLTQEQERYYLFTNQIDEYPFDSSKETEIYTEAKSRGGEIEEGIVRISHNADPTIPNGIQKEYEMTHKYSGSLLSDLETQDSFEGEGLVSFLNRNNYNVFQVTSAAVVSQREAITDYIDDNYQNLSSYSNPTISNQLMYDQKRNYGDVENFEYGLNDIFEFLGIDISYDAINLKTKTYKKADYPFKSGSYNPAFGRYFPIIEYPDIESVISPPEDFLGGLMDNIIGTLGDLTSAILNSTSSWLSTAGQDIVAGTWWHTNETRTLIEGLISTEYDLTKDNADFCRLSVGYPVSEGPFNDGTGVELKYYYPEGQVRGVTYGDLDTFVVISDLFFLSAVDGNDTLSAAPNGDFIVTSSVGSEDLDFLGLPENSVAELFYQNAGGGLWDRIASAGDTVMYDKMGIYALGVRVIADDTPPIVQIVESSLDEQMVKAIIYDEDYGINWSKVKVKLDGNIISHTRMGISDTILFDINSAGITGQVYLSVEAQDISENLGYDVILLDIETSNESVESFDYILRIFPNPTTEYINLIYEIEEQADYQLKIYDLNGRVVKVQSSEMLYPGIFAKQIKVSELSQGTYIISLYENGRILESRQFVKGNP